MQGEGYRQPTIRSILGGCLLALLVLLPIVFISNTVKLVGAAFVFLPSRLGLLPSAAETEARSLDMSTSPNSLELPSAGPYLVYTDHFELLDITLRLEQSSATPWLRISDPATGAAVPMDYVGRGLMPYDPLFAPGRPVFRFVASRPGNFTAEHMTRDARIVIVPDYTTGREMEILLAAVLQILAVVLVVGAVARGRARERARRIEALLAPGRVSPKDLQRRYAGSEEKAPPR
ncbi:MAG TPA: hypothetical protein VFI11_05550 [Anaerolineales bacterium]|nr:hypothetical protein [Anaerolineales bacterium]